MIDPSDNTDYQLRHGRNHMTGGGDALWGLDPSEILSRMEEEGSIEAQREREALREEIFNALLEYLFADGPEPWNVSARARAFISGVIDRDENPPDEFTAAYEKMIKGHDDDFWVTTDLVEKALKPYAKRFREIRQSLIGNASLCTWFAELSREPDEITVADSLHSLTILLISQGARPINITSVAYCLAKTLKPSLIGSMSLHTIAILSGDKGGRATPQARCKRVYTILLKQAGARATRYHHQKSAATAELCRLAQLGNHNRNKNIRKKHRK